MKKKAEFKALPFLYQILYQINPAAMVSMALLFGDLDRFHLHQPDH